MSERKSTCSICGKAVSWKGNAFRPFCSERCQLVDLQGWFGEHYRIPLDESTDPEDAIEPNHDSSLN